MKRLFYIVWLCILFISCGKDNNQPLSPKIRILFLGNSFTEDAVSYVPFIINNVCRDIDLSIGVASIGGCSLAQHCANILSEPQEVAGSVYEAHEYNYYRYTTPSSKWEERGSWCIDDVLKDEQWDIITLQQSGNCAAKDWSVYYAPFIYKIQNALSEKLSHQFRLGWLIIHGAYSNTSEGVYDQWLGAAFNSKRVIDSTDVSILFPYGTAVQNLRTTPLHNLGDFGELLADSGHLQEGLGCLAAAYSVSIVILNLLGIPSSEIIGEQTRPTRRWNEKVHVLGPHYGDSNTVVGITDENCLIAQFAALYSCKYPFSVTDSTNLVYANRYGVDSE